MVRSVEPSSITSHSTVSMPGSSRGRSASVCGSVASSLKHGIWMMSFMRRGSSRLPNLSRRMESATLIRTRPLASLRSVSAAAWARLIFAALAVGTLVGFLVYPTYPNYDSYYSLIWGREVLHLHAPTFEGFRVPTEHPLAIAVGAVLSLFGESGDRMWVALTFATYLWLVWGMYKLGRVTFTPLVGAVAAALLLTRFDYGFLAARGYIDIPYMALVVWAAVLEAQRPRRGLPVFLLLAAAGMLRPEAWVLAGLYWLWMAWPASRRDRLVYAGLAAI